MTLQEVIEQARALYPGMGELKPVTARTWTQRGLMPGVLRQAGRGKGKGRVGDYPETSPAEMATAAFLKYGLERRFKDADIARARQFWISGGEARGDEVGEILPGLLILARCCEMAFEPNAIGSLAMAGGLLVYAAKLEQARRGMDMRQGVRAEFRVISTLPALQSGCPKVQVVLRKIEPTEGKDEIEVTV